MKKSCCSLIVFIVIFFFPICSLAQEEGLSVLAKSKYFSLYSPQDVDVYSLLNKLDFNYFLQPDTLLIKNNQDPNEILVKVLDALYLEVSDILDIHIYSFHGNIKILPDQNSVSAVFKKFFRTDFPERSFYVHEKNTIYVSLADLNSAMLGHEIAHAIISHYFVVPPPAKVQEVLSGFVEYTLRKSAGTLP